MITIYITALVLAPLNGTYCHLEEYDIDLSG